MVRIATPLRHVRLAARAVAALFACLCASATASASPGATPVARTQAPRETIATTNVSAYDLIELQISYTTILARYYIAVEPRTLARGARGGVASELTARGIRGAVLAAVPARVDFGRGGDYIDTLVVATSARYGKRIDAHRLVAAAVAGELASLHDPYSVSFRPQQFRRFNAYLGNASFGGIGAVLSYDAEHARAPIERTIAGGPAEANGIRAGDAIVAIDGKPLGALYAMGVRAALRGKIGSTVRVTVERDGVRETFALVRAEVRDPAVRAKLFGNVGYLALARFGDRAGAELGAAIADERARGATAFVLDLRGNGGGYGDEATAVAGLFIGGPIFITRERAGPPRSARAKSHAAIAERLAVLVDGDSASAAEIVAGAIQDAGAGTIVGTKTFGKGLVQSVFPLPDGSAIKLTTARYTTPKGRDIDRIGIVPDLAVAEPAGSLLGDPATDPQLAAALSAVAAPASPVPTAPGAP